jgi:hypothetical protein
MNDVWSGRPDTAKQQVKTNEFGTGKLTMQKFDTDIRDSFLPRPEILADEIYQDLIG